MAAIELKRGKPRSYTLHFTLAGAPQNIAGKSIRLTVRHRHSDVAVTIEKTIGAGITVLDAPGGIARVDFAGADTAAMDPKAQAFIYDVQVATSGTDPVITEEGTLVVTPAVTTVAP
jgi:hypothetical protein